MKGRAATSSTSPALPWKPVAGEWVLARSDAMVGNSPVDVYLIVDAPSLYVHAFESVAGESMSTKVAQGLLTKAFESRGAWPPRLAVPKGDPSAAVIARLAAAKRIAVAERPLWELAAYVAPVLESFARQGFSVAGLSDLPPRSNEAESAQAMIPDSYDRCPCASGAKYKFCCKKIFREVVHAMAAVEEGDHGEALRWMKEAEKIAGLSAEVLCRYAIVYSYLDQEQSAIYLRQCLEKNPQHPRAHYLLGIDHREHERLDAAIDEYRKAIENYPRSDRFHLNETWNNLGTAYHELGDLAQAKEAWETAIMLMPSDEMSVQNLLNCICDNADLPAALREPSALVAQMLKRKGYR